MIHNEELELILDKIDPETPAPTDEPERQYYYIKLGRALIKVREQELGHPVSFCVTTFGCQMNARDSEKLRGTLLSMGMQEYDSEEADFVIYNTCTIRENANSKLYGHLGFLQNQKKRHPHKMIALCGCMMQEEHVIRKLRKSYKFVNLVFGTHNIYKFAELVVTMLQGDRMVIDIWPDTDRIVEDLPNKLKYDFKAGVNITFGCNNFCSYCIVPYVRGRERSRKPEDIIREIEGFASQGVVEVMLLGQNVNSYGKTLEEPISFARLLQMVEKVEGIERIRFMTSHPKDLSEELIEVMKNSTKICRHLHLPLQSGSSRILKVMNRRYTKEGYLALVEKLRQAIPDIALTTDIIVGFPGETEADFQETLDVVRRVRYDSAFTFLYSRRTGTPAAEMEDQVPADVAQDRFERLLAEIQKIAWEVCGRDVGKVMDVLVEHVNTQDASYVTGRLSNNTVVHFPGCRNLIGTIVPVKLIESKGFYYIGEQVE